MAGKLHKKRQNLGDPGPSAHTGARRAKRRPAASGALFDRFLAGLAALVCCLFLAGLRDVRERPPPAAMIPAPPIPTSITERDATLSARVVDAEDKPVPGASVRAFAIREGRAYFAGERATDAGGSASLGALPRGETWVLAYAAGRARASARLVLEAGPRELKLVLAPAKALDVVVVGDDDKAIEAAEVEVRASDPLPYRGLTDATGAARVDRLGPAPYAVTATARGYDPVTRTSIVPGPTPLRIKLEHLATIDVEVVDEEGHAAANAAVLVAGTGLWPSRSATTDENGKVKLGGLRGGVYDLKARLGDRVSKTELAFPLRRGEAKPLKLVVAPGRRIAITVTDGDAEGAAPVPQAAVALVEDGLSSFPIYGKTDARGAVLLGPIAAGRASVSARAAGFVPKSAVAVEPTATEVRVPLVRGGVVLGDVVDDRGFPVPGATLEVIGTDGDGMPIDETSAALDFRDSEFSFALPGSAPLIPAGELGVMPGPIPDLPQGAVAVGGAPPEARGGDPWVTRRDGDFHCEPVSPGTLRLLVRHPSYVEVLSDAFILRPGGTQTLHIVLREGGALEGRVVEEDSHHPVSGARIELAATKGTLERVTYAADDGTFAFAAVPDEVLLSVSRPETPGDIVVRMVVPVPDRDRKAIEIVLPKVRETVKLRVSDDRGYAIDHVEVRAVSLAIASPLRRTVFTNADGDTEIPDAVGLPLRLVLVRPSKAPVVHEVLAAPKELRLTMPEGVRAHGKVASRQGRDRESGVDVTVFSMAGVRHVRTDDDGEFTIDDLAAGRVRLVARKDGHPPAELVAHVEGDRDHPSDLGVIELLEAGEVEGEVVDPKGDGVPGARVAVGRAPAYLPLGPLPPGVVATDREGRFTLAGVPEGELSLEAYAPDLGRASSEKITVRPNRTTRRVRIQLPGGEAAKKEPKGAGSLAITLGEQRGGVVAVMVPPFGEAELAGIEPGDRLVKIDGHEVKTIEAARKRLTGPLVEDLVLEIARDETPPVDWLVRVRRERVRR